MTSTAARAERRVTLSPRATSSAIEVHDLTKAYGVGATRVDALRGVDLTIAPGEFVAIMGPSGSGKSTLLHILGALESSSSGTVAVGGNRYDGLDDKHLTRFRRDHIGFVFQFFNLLGTLTALENVLLPALIAGERPDAHMERARELLATVGLADRAHHVPSESARAKSACCARSAHRAGSYARREPPDHHLRCHRRNRDRA